MRPALLVPPPFDVGKQYTLRDAIYPPVLRYSLHIVNGRSTPYLEITAFGQQQVAGLTPIPNGLPRWDIDAIRVFTDVINGRTKH